MVASANTVFDIEAPEITTEHLDTAVILVFGQRRVADRAMGAILSTNFQLPVTFISNSLYRAQILSPSASDKGVAVVRIPPRTFIFKQTSRQRLEVLQSFEIYIPLYTKIL